MRKREDWLEYEGQTTSEILACKTTHSIFSLIAAFEWGLQAKASATNENALTAEERLVLAVKALHREVGNGGYHQFFLNSSRRFAPIIVDSLLRIGCADTAAITKKAIATLHLREMSPDSVSRVITAEDPIRDQILDDCDNQFYQLDEIKEKLFRFIEDHQERIHLVKSSPQPTSAPPLSPI